ncbi:MAG: thiol:disulfide interchange protein DsbA/DsbL [Cycloclasticus sp.]|nr:thiol:disulfide interchange protein DsbA/DsbL [Cycloclasticus sp.]MBQ0789622.1 thiol:disulfide interchange protein DsbA/DsbL [Cycloclasticus sp.]
MRKLLVLLVACLTMYVGTAYSEAVDYDEGIDFQLIKPVQPTDDPDRLEVVEVFWYGCPHCHHFEPTLGPWAKNAPADVNFYRLPAVFNATWEMHARAYFAADILDVLEVSHDDLFHAMHVEHKTFNTVEKLAKFYAKYGIDEALFEKTYHSFVVNTKIARSKEMVKRYGITGVPAVVVEGKYLITGAMAKSYGNMIKIIDFLLAKERKAKQ